MPTKQSGCFWSANLRFSTLWSNIRLWKNNVDVLGLIKRKSGLFIRSSQSTYISCQSCRPLLTHNMYRIFCTWVSREIRTNIITITTLTFHKSFDKENVLEVHECISGIRLRYKLAFFNPDHYCVVLKYSIYFTLDRRKRVFQEKKNEGPTEIWTRIAGFKVQSANHYTMGPILWKELKDYFINF